MIKFHLLNIASFVLDPLLYVFDAAFNFFFLTTEENNEYVNVVLYSVLNGLDHEISTIEQYIIIFGVTN